MLAPQTNKGTKLIKIDPQGTSICSNTLQLEKYIILTTKHDGGSSYSLKFPTTRPLLLFWILGAIDVESSFIVIYQTVLDFSDLVLLFLKRKSYWGLRWHVERPRVKRSRHARGGASHETDKKETQKNQKHTFELFNIFYTIIEIQLEKKCAFN